MRGMTFLFAVALAVPAMAQEPGAVGQIEMAASMSPSEKLEFANSAVQEMSAAEKSARKLLEAAQKEGESANERVVCINNKLVSIRSLQEVSERASGAMQQAFAASAPEQADHEFRKIAVAISKVRQLLAEAEACAGQTGETGGTQNVDVSGDLLAEDIDDYFDDTEDLVPPADVTPFE